MKFHSTCLFVSSMVMTGVLLTGCGGGADNNASNGTSNATSESAATTASIPTTLFTADAPADVMSLLEAKTNAAVGDEVTFTARIGGRVEPFTGTSAVFLVADVSIPTCTELHGEEGCPTPWDYCCEPKDNLMKNMATVQIVDADGKPLPGSAKGLHGLDPEATIIVTGSVVTSDGPTFVVNARRIHVTES
jgi:hypothetical protein